MDLLLADLQLGCSSSILVSDPSKHCAEAPLPLQAGKAAVCHYSCLPPMPVTEASQLCSRLICSLSSDKVILRLHYVVLEAILRGNGGGLNPNPARAVLLHPGSNGHHLHSALGEAMAGTSSSLWRKALSSGTRCCRPSDLPSSP